MYCVNCGKEIADGVTFCPYCGASVDATPVREYDPYVEDVLATGEPVQEEAAVAGVETTVPAIEQQTVEVKPAPAQETVSEQPTAKAANGFAIAGFVCSFFVPILGIIFGSIGMAKSKKMNGSGLGLAIAALSISISFIIINMLTCGSAFAELFENIFYFEEYYDNPYYY